MEKQNRKESKLGNLPVAAVDFIRLVIKKMRYRRKVRRDVQAELTAHFEDELKDCKTDEQREQKARQLIAGFGDVKLLAILLRRAKKRCRPRRARRSTRPRIGSTACGRPRRPARRPGYARTLRDSGRRRI